MAEYTKGEWKVEDGDFGYKIICDQTKPDDTIDIAEIDDYKENPQEPKANAYLIVTAVNACASVNRDNPMAVAESIRETYEALEKIVAEGTRCLNECQQDKSVRQIYNIDEVDRIARFALAKATNKA